MFLQIFSTTFVIKNPVKKPNIIEMTSPIKTFVHSFKFIAEKFLLIAIAEPDIPAINACDWLVGIPKKPVIPDQITIENKAADNPFKAISELLPKFAILKTVSATFDS